MLNSSNLNSSATDEHTMKLSWYFWFVDWKKFWTFPPCDERRNAVQALIILQARKWLESFSLVFFVCCCLGHEIYKFTCSPLWTRSLSHWIDQRSPCTHTWHVEVKLLCWSNRNKGELELDGDSYQRNMTQQENELSSSPPTKNSEEGPLLCVVEGREKLKQFFLFLFFTSFFFPHPNLAALSEKLTQYWNVKELVSAFDTVRRVSTRRQCGGQERQRTPEEH